MKTKSVLHDPEAVYAQYEHLRSLKKESFNAIYLDCKNKMIHTEQVSLGTLTMNLVHPREVFRPAVLYAAASIILIHNHPSGDPTPSAEDLKITRQLVRAGQMMEIEILDHVIVASEGFVSLRRRGLMSTNERRESCLPTKK